MLKIKDIHKSYGEVDVLKGINLNVKEGEIKALIGINGSGKSTLIEIVCGVKKTNTGEIYINNINHSDKKQKKAYKHSFGYMPQQFCLFVDLTVRENLEYMCAVYNLNKSVVDEFIELFSLKSHEKVLAGNLSGGYRQLLSCACAIIHKPKMIILDEPTSAMDPIFRRQFWKIIKATKEWGSSVLIITHFIEELLECDSFACLNKGLICHDGLVDEFKTKNFINIEEILRKYSTEESK